MEQTKKRRGVNRLLFFLVLIGSIFSCVFVTPIMPHIQLAAEPLTAKPLTNFLGQDFHITNTLVALLIADVLIILLALAIRRQIKSGVKVLTGIPGAFVSILEAFYGMAEATAGKWAKKIFLCNYFLVGFIREPDGVVTRYRYNRHPAPC